MLDFRVNRRAGWELGPEQGIECLLEKTSFVN